MNVSLEGLSDWQKPVLTPGTNFHLTSMVLIRSQKQICYCFQLSRPVQNLAHQFFNLTYYCVLSLVVCAEGHRCCTRYQLHNILTPQRMSLSLCFSVYSCEDSRTRCCRRGRVKGGCLLVNKLSPVFLRQK